LNIFEGLFVLALDDEEGDFVESIVKTIEYLLSGAILAELAVQNRIDLVDERLHVIDQTPTDHPILDKALFDILETPKPRKLKYWINTLTYNNFLGQVGDYLVVKGMLTRHKKRLHLVSINSSQEINVSAKHAIKSRLRDIVLAEQEPDLSEKVLLAFLYYGDILKLIYTHGERKEVQKRVKKLIEHEEGGIGFGDLIDDILASSCEAIQ